MITFPTPDELAALDWVKRQIGPPEQRAQRRALQRKRDRCAKVGHEAGFVKYLHGELFCTLCDIAVVR